MNEPKKKLWLFDAEALLPGDVILEAGATWAGRGIRLIEWGKFSHALLWLGDGNFIEAVAAGARVISFKRVIIEDRDRWAVLRLVDDPNAGPGAADQARRLAHLSYDFRGAIGTKLGLLQREDRTSLFCSQLVAAAYDKAGHSLAERHTPNQVTPKVLHSGSRLKLVAHTFVEIGEYDVRQPDREAAYSNSLTWLDQVISQDAVAAAAPHLPKEAAVPGNLQQLYETLGELTPEQGKPVSDALLKVFDASGHFTLIEEQEDDISKWLEAEIAALAGKRPDGLAEAAKEFGVLAKIYEVAARRHGDLFEKFSNARSNQCLPLWQALAECHERRAAVFTRLQRIAERGAAATGPLGR